MHRLLQKGFSLIELMIALVLGSILVLGATQLIISSSNLGTTAINLNNNQDIAKTVLDLLGGESGRAGYNGCSANGMVEWLSYNPTTWANRERAYAVVPLMSGGVGIKFSYGLDEKLVGTDVPAGELKGIDCLNRDLYYREMTYQNCGDDLCIKGASDPTTTKTKFDLVDSKIANVNIEKIVITLEKPDPTEGNEEFNEITVGTGGDFTSNFTEATEPDLIKLQQAKTVTYYIKVTTVELSGDKAKSMTRVERKYSGTYRLRNL